VGYQIINVNIDSITQNKAIGVKFPFDVPGVFTKSYTTLEQAKTNVRSLLLTRKGERYAQPNLGTSLLNLLFQPNISELKDVISSTITDAISYWLPYIDITDLSIITQEDDSTLIHDIKITIQFTVSGIVSNETITIFAGENGVLLVE
jgi:phage baseplate assembly protein W